MQVAPLERDKTPSQQGYSWCLRISTWSGNRRSHVTWTLLWPLRGLTWSIGRSCQALTPIWFFWLCSLRYSWVKQVLKPILSSRSKCCILAFDPAKNAIPRWCTGRRRHILMAVMRGNRVGGNWLMKWDKVKKIPLVHL